MNKRAEQNGVGGEKESLVELQFPINSTAFKSSVSEGFDAQKVATDGFLNR